MSPSALLAQLLSDPQAIERLHLEDLAAVVGELERVRVLVMTRCQALAGGHGGVSSGQGAPAAAAQDLGAGSERWLTPKEVAARLRTSVRWVYTHLDVLGGCRLSRRCVRVPLQGVKAYEARRRKAH